MAPRSLRSRPAGRHKHSRVGADANALGLHDGDRGVHHAAPVVSSAPQGRLVPGIAAGVTVTDWNEEQIADLRADRPVSRDEGQGTALSWVCTGEDTGGEDSLVYGECTPGVRVFPHYQTLYQETLHVFDGVIEGKIAGRDMHVQAGGEDVVPRRAVHGLRSVGDRTVRLLVEVRPAHPGFEKWLVTLQNMAADGLTHPDGRPRNLHHATLILVESDINLPARPGPGRALTPVFRLMVRRAWRRDIDRMLEEKDDRQG